MGKRYVSDSMSSLVERTFRVDSHSQIVRNGSRSALKSKVVFTIACMQVILLGNVSCHKKVWTSMIHPVTDSVQLCKLRFDTLLRQVCDGDTDACLSLAECYFHGEGVSQSFLNATILIFIYEERAGCPYDSILARYAGHSLLRSWLEVVDDGISVDTSDGAMSCLHHYLPLEAKALDVYGRAMGDTSCLSALSEIESKGGELAVILQLMCYKEHGDVLAYEQGLEKYSRRFPIFSAMLAARYQECYQATGDTTYILHAADCYRYADAQGMLLSHFAAEMHALYTYWCGQGLLSCDGIDMERLARLAHKE